MSPRDIFAEEYHLFHSFAYFQAGRYVEAAASAERAIQLRPEHPVLYIMAASSYGHSGEIEKSKDSFAAGHHQYFAKALKVRLRELVADI